MYGEDGEGDGEESEVCMNWYRRTTDNYSAFEAHMHWEVLSGKSGCLWQFSVKDVHDKRSGELMPK